MSKENYVQKLILNKKIYIFDEKDITNYQVIYNEINNKIVKAKWSSIDIVLKLFKNNDCFEKEIEILNELKGHPNIINFYGLLHHNMQYHLVQEYANNRNLNDYLQTHFKNLNWNDKINIAKDIANGVFYIHNKNIIHNDLHSKNILVNDNKMKISDFEFARYENEIHIKKINNGMVAYIEPKAIEDWNYICDKRSDIYALGVIFWQISSGRKPFINHTTREAIAISISLCKREIKIEGTPEKYKELYETMWNQKPDNRLEIKEIFDILKEFNI